MAPMKPPFNRAVLTASTSSNPAHSPDLGLYLHYNGGYDSVTAFLSYCRMKGYYSPEGSGYGWARLCQVICNFLASPVTTRTTEDGEDEDEVGDVAVTGGVGFDSLFRLNCDNGDNGVYVFRDWKIVKRVYFKGGERMEQREYPLIEMLIAIDGKQPDKEQIGEDGIRRWVEDGMKSGVEEFGRGVRYFDREEEVVVVEYVGFGGGEGEGVGEDGDGDEDEDEK